MANTNLHAPTKNIREALQYGFGVWFSCMAHPQMGNTNLMCPNKAVLANTHLWDIIKARQIISRSFLILGAQIKCTETVVLANTILLDILTALQNCLGNPFLILDAPLDGTYQPDVHQTSCIQQYSFWGNI